MTSIPSVEIPQNNHAEDSPCVLAIGNFDGVHKGHAKLIGQAKKLADTNNIQLIVVTFDPLPGEFFANKAGESYRKIIGLDQRIKYLQSLGANKVAALPFNENLQSMSPQQFVEKIIVETYNAKIIVVGNDFHFGHKRSGNITTLSQLCEKLHIEVKPVKLFGNGSKYSSRDVRSALESDDLKTVNSHLGYSWQLTGKVIDGNKRGRKLGFATANILPDQPLPGLKGVYAGSLRVNNNWLAAAINIGTRPTFKENNLQCEAHILEEQESKIDEQPLNLYNKHIALAFHIKLRDEQQFANSEELITQIKKDIAQTKKWHQNNSPVYGPVIES